MRNTDLKENQKGNLFYRWRERHKLVDTFKREWSKTQEKLLVPDHVKRKQKGRNCGSMQSLYPKREGTPEDAD